MDDNLENKICELEKKYGSLGNLRRSCKNSNDILNYAKHLKSENRKWNGGVFFVSVIFAVIILFFMPPDISIIVFIPLYMMISCGTRYFQRKTLIYDLVNLALELTQ